MTKQHSVNRIISNTTTTVTTTTCVVHQVVISCNNAGTTWAMRMQSRFAPVNILIPLFTLGVPTDGNPNVVLHFEEPVAMQDGIDIVTTGGAPAGAVDVWVTRSQGP